MMCNEHPKPLTDSAHIAVKACDDCGNLTYSDCQLCAHCSQGYDQCQRCRASLCNQVDPRRLKAFNSPRAQEIRRNKLLARQAFVKKKRDAETLFAVTTAEYTNLLRERVAPFRLRCEQACKPHRDKVAAVSSSLSDEQVRDDLVSLQSAKVHPRLREAIEKCDAACASIHEAYDRDVKVFFTTYRDAMRPARAMLKQELASAQDELNQQMHAMDRQLERLVYCSTRYRYMLLGAIGIVFFTFFRWNR